MRCFEGHVVQSFNTCLIVIVEQGWRGETVDGVTAVRDTAREIPKVHNFL